MAKPFMNCNFKNCGAALTKFAWITRCSHVFCDEHGEMFFRKGGSQVRCPACNEVKNKENDVIRNDLNPSDLLISTVPPGKALEFAMHASRLWTHQMEYRRKCHTDQVVRKYESHTIESTVQLQTENKELKNYIQAIERKLKHTNDELFKMRARLNRYKSAYHANRAFPQVNQNNISYEQRPHEDRLHQNDDSAIVRHSIYPVGDLKNLEISEVTDWFNANGLTARVHESKTHSMFFGLRDISSIEFNPPNTRILGVNVDPKVE